MQVQPEPWATATEVANSPIPPTNAVSASTALEPSLRSGARGCTEEGVGQEPLGATKRAIGPNIGPIARFKLYAFATQRFLVGSTHRSTATEGC